MLPEGGPGLDPKEDLNLPVFNLSNSWNGSSSVTTVIKILSSTFRPDLTITQNSSDSPNSIGIDLVKEICDYVCQNDGGYGAFREFADLILRVKNKN